MGDGSRDLQKVWHEFVGQLFVDTSFLDVGAGVGLSKERLEREGKNYVLTQDINRAYMNYVDVVKPIEEIDGKWDIVTAFDVIEHVYNPQRFLAILFSLSFKGVFVTTPNWCMSPRDWHYTPLLFESMFPIEYSSRYFLRYKGPDFDRIEEVTQEAFIGSNDTLALGILCTIE